MIDPLRWVFKERTETFEKSSLQEFSFELIVLKTMNLNLIKTLLSVPENQSELVSTVTKYFEHKDPHRSTGFSSPLRALARVVRFVVVGGVSVDVEIGFFS